MNPVNKFPANPLLQSSFFNAGLNGPQGLDAQHEQAKEVDALVDQIRFGAADERDLAIDILIPLACLGGIAEQALIALYNEPGKPPHAGEEICRALERASHKTCEFELLERPPSAPKQNVPPEPNDDAVKSESTHALCETVASLALRYTGPGSEGRIKEKIQAFREQLRGDIAEPFDLLVEEEVDPEYVAWAAHYFAQPVMDAAEHAALQANGVDATAASHSLEAQARVDNIAQEIIRSGDRGRRNMASANLALCACDTDEVGVRAEAKLKELFLNPNTGNPEQDHAMRMSLIYGANERIRHVRTLSTATVDEQRRHLSDLVQAIGSLHGASSDAAEMNDRIQELLAMLREPSRSLPAS